MSAQPGARRLEEARSLAVDAVGMTRADLARKLMVIADVAVDYWRSLPAGHLSERSALEYGRNVQILSAATDKLSIRIGLLGSLPNMWEQGAPPWDLRETVLKSPKAKRSKDGHLYLSIPFRHAGADTRGDAGKPIGSQYPAADRANIARAVEAAYKRLRTTESGVDAQATVNKLKQADPEAGAREEARLRESSRDTLWGGSAFVEPKKRGTMAAGLAPKLKAHHATDIYAGMYRMGKLYAKAKQSYGLTFRTISTNPSTRRDEQGKPALLGRGTANWMHPGFKPLNLAERVMNRLQSRIIPDEMGA